MRVTEIKPAAPSASALHTNVLKRILHPAIGLIMLVCQILLAESG
jgi:hypothetical protein